MKEVVYHLFRKIVQKNQTLPVISIHTTLVAVPDASRPALIQKAQIPKVWGSGGYADLDSLNKTTHGIDTVLHEFQSTGAATAVSAVG